MASGVLATGNSLRVARFTPLSVACADSTTATSSSNGVLYSSSVVGWGLAARRRLKISWRLAGFMGRLRTQGVTACRATFSMPAFRPDALSRPTFRVHPPCAAAPEEHRGCVAWERVFSAAVSCRNRYGCAGAPLVARLPPVVCSDQKPQREEGTGRQDRQQKALVAGQHMHDEAFGSYAKYQIDPGEQRSLAGQLANRAQHHQHRGQAEAHCNCIDHAVQ